MRLRTVPRAVIGWVSAIAVVSGILAPAAQADESVPLVGRVETPAISDAPFILAVESGDPVRPLAPGTVVSFRWNDGRHKADRVADTQVEPSGVARVRITAWKPTSVTASTADGAAVTVEVRVRPARKPVSFPKAAPSPKRKGELDPPAVGKGANARVKPISASQRKAMVGRSWQQGCVPLSSLREVHVNYWGADGYRYRGVLIAREGVASRAAEAFTRLYKAGYRFHSIHPVDRYGRSPRGPGANDYASMRAGNTSMFNCRYVVGQESSRAWSPHMSGCALDVNPWENPYVARGGVYPDRYWLDRRGSSNPMVLTAGSRPVRILAASGWRWAGGRYRDYHHFDC